MIYDKRKGSLLNYIQMPLNVTTPYGTYLGTGYTETNEPEYILSHVKVKTFPVNELIFSNLSKHEIIRDVIPLLQVTNGIVGYNYEITGTEINYGYITSSSQRISLETGKISVSAAQLILDKQLRAIGNVLEKFIKKPLGQQQFDALLHFFFYEGIDKIEGHPLIILINQERWYDITDEIQTNIKRENGKVDDRLAVLRTKTAKMWSFVPGF